MPDNPDTLAHPLTDSAANRDNDSLIHSAIGNPQSGSAARSEEDPLSSARLFFVIAGLTRPLFLACALLTPGLGASQRVSNFANVDHRYRALIAPTPGNSMRNSGSGATDITFAVRGNEKQMKFAFVATSDGRPHPKFTACGNMQMSGHELWALWQWELLFAVLLGSSISGFAAPPEVTEAMQQPSRAVRRRSSPPGHVSHTGQSGVAMRNANVACEEQSQPLHRDMNEDQDDRKRI
ncbi:hypothetical protein EDB83DRAFT_2312518 [Lactarius deliciosus]|nr:hypothetical protein EDB83DRAFT_2312518 [Lactarius deliciosus]